MTKLIKELDALALKHLDGKDKNAARICNEAADELKYLQHSLRFNESYIRELEGEYEFFNYCSDAANTNKKV